MTELSLYNTLSGKKEKFEPIKKGQVGMYVCGPTVYDRPHVGNARAVVVYDVLFRLLQHIYGEKNVNYVRNITDVDDKINAAAKENGEPISKLTERIISAFHQDMDALGNLRPTKEPKATEHIKEMCDLIKKLIDNGYAYEAEGHVLFDVTKPSDNSSWHYGMLSRRKLEDLQAGARVEVEKYKRNAGDFVLWKPADEGDDASSVFDSPWGKGRPGWHIECSAMSTNYLGEDFDIHGGGADLKFPHHENEIAQSCCGNKGSTFAKYWVHNGFVTVNGEKMSKSLGNFTTVKDLLDKGVKGEVIRYVLLATKYNEPLDFTEKRIEDAEKALNKFYREVEEVNEYYSEPGGIEEGYYDDNGFPKMFIEFLCNDLNTPMALSLMHQSKSPAATKKMGELLGFFNTAPEEWLKGQPNPIRDSLEKAYIDVKIKERDAAKKAKNYAEADKIRDELAKQGIILEDSPSGTKWRKA